MEYTGNMGLLLIAVIIGGFAIMAGLIYFSMWLIIKKTKNKEEETE